jgi:6-pyruvoyltetrahydropterin/6-carboxytetrahydropterin synthase
MFVIQLAKETFKFSCSHFTILAADKAERLHGHNYQLRADLEVSELNPQLGLAFDFNAVKPHIVRFCDSLDERILLPLNSPYLQIERGTQSVDVRFGKKHYVFPNEDALCLPLVNITSEELARFAGQKLAADLSLLPHWTSLQLHIEETRGQSVSFRLKR